MGQGNHARSARRQASPGIGSRLFSRRTSPRLPRTETALAVDSGAITAGSARREIPRDATPDQVLDHYVEFIRELRGAGKLAQLSLREEDLDALASALGDTPREIERRLVELIECSRSEARRLRRAILKRQLVVPVAGFALGIGGLGSATALNGVSPLPQAAVTEDDRASARTIDLEYDAPAPEPAPPAASAPTPAPAPAPAPTNRAGETITRSGSGDDWAEVIDPLVITSDDPAG